MLFPRKKEFPADKKLSEFIYDYISRSRRLSKRYKSQYRNIARHLENFSTVTGLPIFTNSFTEPLSEEFIEYLKGKNLMLSTIRDIFQRVCCMLRRAGRAGYATNFGFEIVTVKEESACAIYLTLEELYRINNLTSLSKEAKAVRDRFLVGCFTALRISDYRSLSIDNFVNNTIQLKTQKTGEFVVIPVHPIILEILKRNAGKLPKLPSQQAFGATIKRVCRKANINDSVVWERTIGHKVVRKRVKKWQLVSSHTARRSGATNMYLAGIPTDRIMLLTGHRTEEAFFRYIRINKTENAKTLSEHPFFK